MEKPLNADLRELRDLFRHYVGSHQRPTIDACRELVTSLTLMAEKADGLVDMTSTEVTDEPFVQNIAMYAL